MVGELISRDVEGSIHSTICLECLIGHNEEFNGHFHVMFNKNVLKEQRDRC